MRDLTSAATVGVVGAGAMGTGIAQVAASRGHRVVLCDARPGAAEGAGKTIDTLLGALVAKGKLTDSSRRETLSRIELGAAPLGNDLSAYRGCDFVIEAVVEDLDIKRRVFGEVEVRVAPDTVIATNTSSLSVSALAEGIQRPERFCGFHFFNPVHRMPLVEVVRGRQTSDQALVTAVTLARKLGKTPVVVNDAPGFIVNRVLMPYLREAMYLFEEGFPLADIDASMRRFGMPMGPFEVLDEVGLDVAGKVAGILSRAFPERMQPAEALEQLVAKGRLGRKSGAGFYLHRGGKRKLDPTLDRLLGARRRRTGHTLDMLSERMTLAMVNESARCLEDGVVADAGSVDLALVFGAGFPPFRGGPLRYADSVGLSRIVSRLAALRAEKGPRYEPALKLASLAAEGGTFTQPVA